MQCCLSHDLRAVLPLQFCRSSLAVSFARFLKSFATLSASVFKYSSLYEYVVHVMPYLRVERPMYFQTSCRGKQCGARARGCCHSKLKKTRKPACTHSIVVSFHFVLFPDTLSLARSLDDLSRELSSYVKCLSIEREVAAERRVPSDFHRG